MGKAAPKPKKNSGSDRPNVHELLGKLKPVAVDSASKSLPAPSPNKQKARSNKVKTPAKTKKAESATDGKNESLVPAHVLKKPSFGQSQVASLSEQSEKSFEDIFD